MKRQTKVFSILLALVLSLLLSAACHAVEFKIAIMQDKKGVAKQYRALLDYLKGKGVDAQFVSTTSYPLAAKLFTMGKADAMFSGSGIAGSMIIKDLGYPAVRPVAKDGTSTYWAVILAPKGSPRFNGKADYFKDKKVMFSSLASSGEFYFRSLDGYADVGATMLNATSHGAAIHALSKGDADIAIVKNRVWDKEIGKYDTLERVGEDAGENPNGTLIVSNSLDKKAFEKVSAILLGLKDDDSALAKEVKDELGIQGYIKTTKDDFKHTLELLKKAGVTKDFEFEYK